MYEFKPGDYVICKPSEEERKPNNVDFEVYSKVIWLSREMDRIILRRYHKQGRLFFNETVFVLSALEEEELYQPMNEREKAEFLANTKDEPAPHKFWNEDTFSCSKAKPGDYVNAAVVENAMNIVSLATMRRSCAQVGEPYSHEIEPQSGKYRPTFATFKCLDGDFNSGIWRFCGYCFKNETTPFGKTTDYGWRERY